VLTHHGFRVLRVAALDRFGHGEVVSDRGVAHTVVAAEMSVAQLKAEGLDVQIDDQFGQPRVIGDGQDRLVEARSFIDLLGGPAAARARSEALGGRRQELRVAGQRDVGGGQPGGKAFEDLAEVI
jgi:hypothetical protein